MSGGNRSAPGGWEVSELYGLRVLSPLRLPGRRPATPGIDVEVCCKSGPEVPPEPPPGRVVFEGRAGASAAFYTATVDGSLRRIRFHGLCEMTLPEDLSRIDCSLAPAAPREAAALLIAGTGLAFLFTLAGDPVLHAAAVEVDGQAVAFAGPSGAGKSTMAAAACSAGARFVTDDVLRVRFGPEPSSVGGCSELRLRPGALDVLEGQLHEGRATFDGRVAVVLPQSSQPVLPIAAVVIPRPAPRASHVELRPLPLSGAALRLFGVPRMAGWRERTLIEGLFEATSRLAHCVPVLEASIPWDPLLRPRAGEHLLEALASAL